MLVAYTAPLEMLSYYISDGSNPMHIPPPPAGRLDLLPAYKDALRHPCQSSQLLRIATTPLIDFDTRRVVDVAVLDRLYRARTRYFNSIPVSFRRHIDV